MTYATYRAKGDNDKITAVDLTKRLVRPEPYNDSLPGEVLEMRDGSRWFHPYGGQAPVCLTAKP